MSAAAAGEFPKWALLELYTFRRDDDESFPDEIEAPVRASGVTTWGARFRIAFALAQPPRISRLYAQLPGFPGPLEEEPLAMLATHRHLALLFFCATTPSEGTVQNFFIFRADEKNPSSCPLKVLPPCTEPEFDYSSNERLRPRPRRQPSNSTPRPHPLQLGCLSLWCGDKEEFVVAELTVYAPTLDRSCTEVFADICLLRSSFTGNQLGGNWHSMRVPIPSTDNDDLWKLSRWQTDAFIPFQQWLCWIDYRKGILFCDVSNKVPAPTISYLWFPPLDKSPLTSTCTSTTYNMYYSGVSVAHHGRALKFVKVTRHDGLDYEALEPDTGFTITCHTLVLGGSMEWKKDYTVTSDDLRGHHLPPRGIPMFPLVDMDRPHVVHFLFIEFGYAYEKMSVLSIDMSTKTVESFYLYMDGNEFLKTDVNECLPTDDADFIIRKSMSPSPTPFLPCEFPKFCYLSRERKRKDME